MELNGAELITKPLATATNSSVPNPGQYGIHRITVCSAHVESGLTADSVRLEPELCNSRVWTSGSDLLQVEQIYDKSGTLIASNANAGESSGWRRVLVPLSTIFGIIAASVVALVRRGSFAALSRRGA